MPRQSLLAAFVRPLSLAGAYNASAFNMCAAEIEDILPATGGNQERNAGEVIDERSRFLLGGAGVRWAVVCCVRVYLWWAALVVGETRRCMTG